MKTRTSLLGLEPHHYISHLPTLLKSMCFSFDKICYVCLNKGYYEAREHISSHGLDPGKFLFVDLLTGRHQEIMPDVSDCIFITTTSDPGVLQQALCEAVKIHKCEAILLDTVSSLLGYMGQDEVLGFVNALKKEEGVKSGPRQTTLISLHSAQDAFKDHNHLVKDLHLFADTSIITNFQR